jgi:phospholipase/lecithinase/hemolysin
MIAFKRFASLAVIVIAFLTAGWAQAIEFKSIVVFGGSVSDPGNFFALFGFQNRPPYAELDPFLVPTGPYSIGGHHSSNGDTWVEQFARPLGLSRNVQPAFRGSSPHAGNYAVAGRGQPMFKRRSICESRLTLFCVIMAIEHHPMRST